MTHRLVRQLLRNKQLDERYHGPTVGLTDWVVLDKIAELSARGTEPGTLRVDLAREGYADMAAFLAASFKYRGGEAEIAASISSLIRAELLVERGGALALPLPAKGARR